MARSKACFLPFCVICKYPTEPYLCNKYCRAHFFELLFSLCISVNSGSVCYSRDTKSSLSLSYFLIYIWFSSVILWRNISLKIGDAILSKREREIACQRHSRYKMKEEGPPAFFRLAWSSLTHTNKKLITVAECT